MAVGHIICLTANKAVVLIPASRLMDMESQGLLVAGQDGIRHRNLSVTVYGVEMLFHSAVGICGSGDSRQDEGIGGTEYDHTSQDHNDLLQTRLDPLLFLQLLGADYRFVIHESTPY